MRVSEFQSRVLRLLASHRNPERYVANAAPLTWAGARISNDIDFFHDREAALQEAVASDAATLEQAGLEIEWTRRFPTICSGLVRDGETGTSLEWLVDSSF